MARKGRYWDWKPSRVLAILATMAFGGCSSSRPNPLPWQQVAVPPKEASDLNAIENAVGPASTAPHAIVAISYQESESAPETVEPRLSDDGYFSGSVQLDPDQLVQLVHEHNPSLQATIAGWEAAAARYPQEVSLDDPMLDVMVAPGSFATSSSVQESWSVEASQKFPWRGKRAMRGEVADANASSAAMDVEDTRLALTLAARLAFADYAAATDTLEISTNELKLLRELRQIAQVKYETNQAPQQDVLQAEVELAESRRIRLEFLRKQRVATARINTLLHRHPGAPVPPPASSAEESIAAPERDELIALAIEHRPDLAALGAKIAAEQSGYCLALQEYHPDIEIYGRYDRYWIDPEQQGSVGIKMNLPVRTSRRRAAVEEAHARRTRAEFEYEARISQIQLDVASARERLQEAGDVIQLYRDETLKVAEQNVQSARAAYESGTISFLALVSAQRQWIAFRRQQVEALAEYQRQHAELERAVGVPLER